MTSTQLPPLKLSDAGDGFSVSVSFPDDAESRPDGSRLDGADADADGGAADRRSVAAAHSPLTPTSPGIPVHPIPALQEAFGESLDEATRGGADKPRLARLDARARRERLLAQDRHADPFDRPWRYRPGQHQHELFKLLAQISFGVYLLLNGMANSNAQVIDILQGHIDEVDEYLEVTLEDLAQAATDLAARIRHLKLPLANMEAFEANERIDHVLTRTDVAMKQWDHDVEVGLRSTAAFTSWLDDQGDAEWRTQRPELVDVFDAMRGNAEGWLLALDDIHDRAQEVNGLLIRLMTVVAEMEKKAGEVSRRTWAQIPPYSSASVNSSSHLRVSSRQSDPRSQPSIRSVSSSGATPGPADRTDAAAAGPRPPAPRPVSRRGSGSSADSRRPGRQAPAPSTSSPEPGSRGGSTEAGRPVASADESLYVLEPRIYTPRTPEQVPFPALDKTGGAAAMPEAGPRAVGGATAKPGSRGSLRQRMSLRSMVPDAIQIPPRSAAETPTTRPTSKYATPPSTTTSQPFDSAYCSDTEARSLGRGAYAGSEPSMSPLVRPHMVHSPRSDYLQYYRPVEASPHSPLQQRPHTAVEPRASAEHQLRARPSRLASSTTAAGDGAATLTARSPGEARSPKKKSSFGWFKKAFSLDEEERAEFEARRARAQMDRYYDGNSPRFLDGRRIR